MPATIWVTVAPAAFWLAVAMLLRPDPAPSALPGPASRCGCCPAHHNGVRVQRIVRRLESERRRTPRPIGWQSPAWTVEVTP